MGPPGSFSKSPEFFQQNIEAYSDPSQTSMVDLHLFSQKVAVIDV